MRFAAHFSPSKRECRVMEMVKIYPTSGSAEDYKRCLDSSPVIIFPDAANVCLQMIHWGVVLPDLTKLFHVALLHQEQQRDLMGLRSPDDAAAARNKILATHGVEEADEIEHILSQTFWPRDFQESVFSPKMLRDYSRRFKTQPASVVVMQLAIIRHRFDSIIKSSNWGIAMSSYAIYKDFFAAADYRNADIAGYFRFEVGEAIFKSFRSLKDEIVSGLFR